MYTSRNGAQLIEEPAHRRNGFPTSIWPDTFDTESEPAAWCGGPDPELEMLLLEEKIIEMEAAAKCKRKSLSNRGSMLAEADELVNGDRNVSYGDPIQDFKRTASYWSGHAGGVLRRKLDGIGFELDEFSVNVLTDIVDNLFDAHDVAIMMTQLKLSRLAWSPGKRDSWVDGAGYLACGFDCSVLEGL